MAASNCWAGHGFEGDDEGQRVLVKAGLLQQRVDVDGVGGQGVGNGGDDAGTVAHGEAQVVLGFEVSADGQLDRHGAGTDGAAFASAGDGEQVADHGDGRGMASAPWPLNAVWPPYWPLERTRLRLPVMCAMGDSMGTRQGWTVA